MSKKSSNRSKKDESRRSRRIQDERVEECIKGDSMNLRNKQRQSPSAPIISDFDNVYKTNEFYMRDLLAIRTKLEKLDVKVNEVFSIKSSDTSKESAATCGKSDHLSVKEISLDLAADFPVSELSQTESKSSKSGADSSDKSRLMVVTDLQHGNLGKLTSSESSDTYCPPRKIPRLKSGSSTVVKYVNKKFVHRNSSESTKFVVDEDKSEGNGSNFSRHVDRSKDFVSEDFVLNLPSSIFEDSPKDIISPNVVTLESDDEISDTNRIEEIEDIETNRSRNILHEPPIKISRYYKSFPFLTKDREFGNRSKTKCEEYSTVDVNSKSFRNKEYEFCLEYSSSRSKDGTESEDLDMFFERRGNLYLEPNVVVLQHETDYSDSLISTDDSKENDDNKYDKKIDDIDYNCRMTGTECKNLLQNANSEKSFRKFYQEIKEENKSCSDFLNRGNEKKVRNHSSNSSLTEKMARGDILKPFPPTKLTFFNNMKLFCGLDVLNFKDENTFQNCNAKEDSSKFSFREKAEGKSHKNKEITSPVKIGNLKKENLPPLVVGDMVSPQKSFSKIVFSNDSCAEEAEKTEAEQPHSLECFCCSIFFSKKGKRKKTKKNLTLA